jgi:hypothetical protein
MRDEEVEEVEEQEPLTVGDMLSVTKLSKDLREASRALTRGEVMFATGRYYQIQRERISCSNMIAAGKRDGTPANPFLETLVENFHQAEVNIAIAMGAYAKTDPRGRWLLSICGIGPVLAAGFMSHIDVTNRPTAGAIWRFAGMDPTVKWEKGQKRPHNAKLKVLCYKAGESFVKTQNLEKDTYGHMYAARKVIEWERNMSGALIEQAIAKQQFCDKGTDAWAWYNGCISTSAAREYLKATDAVKVALKMATSLKTPEARAQHKAAVEAAILDNFRGAAGTGTPMLPPGHIHARARLHAVKMFLSHYHHVAWEIQTGTPPPKPYIIEHGGHAHYLAPPNWPMK